MKIAVLVTILVTNLRFKGSTGLFFVRLCKIVLKRYIRRISEKLGCQYHISTGIVHNFCYRITAKTVCTLDQVLPDGDIERLTHTAIEIIDRIVGYYPVCRICGKQVLALDPFSFVTRPQACKDILYGFGHRENPVLVILGVIDYLKVFSRVVRRFFHRELFTAYGDEVILDIFPHEGRDLSPAKTHRDL